MHDVMSYLIGFSSLLHRAMLLFLIMKAVNPRFLQRPGAVITAPQVTLG